MWLVAVIVVSTDTECFHHHRMFSWIELLPMFLYTTRCKPFMDNGKDSFFYDLIPRILALEETLELTEFLHGDVSDSLQFHSIWAWS